MNVAATIVVHFGDDVDAGAFGVAVLDWELNVDADGNEITSFGPGDELHFLVQHDPALYIDRVAATAGQAVAEGETYREVEQMLSFAEPGEDGGVELTYLPAGSVARDWQQGVTGLNATEGIGWALSGRRATVTGNTPCLCAASYRARFKLYRFICPPAVLAADETAQLEIHIYLEAV
jgi:hypothetical protein